MPPRSSSFKLNLVSCFSGKSSKLLPPDVRFMSKMHQIPRWGAYSAPPDPLAGFKGHTSKGSGRERKGGERKRGGRGGRGRSTCLPPRFDNPGYGPGASVS